MFAKWSTIQSTFIKLKKIFSSEGYTHIYILDKINKPAVAAKLAGIKNIIGPGIKRQKKWLTNKNFLEDKDWLLSYSEQSQKLLKLNNIEINVINNPFNQLKLTTQIYNEFANMN